MSCDPALDNLLSLLKTLSHKVRTPLSIISNDLTYFKTLIDPAECERGILKCRQISEIFQPAQLLKSSSESFETFELEVLLLELFDQRFQTSSSDVVLTGSISNLKQAISWLSELIEIAAVQIVREKVHLTPSIVFTLNKPLDFLIDSKDLQVCSMNELFKKEASEDNIIPLLLDAVLLSFSAQVRAGRDTLELVFQ